MSRSTLDNNFHDNLDSQNNTFVQGNITKKSGLFKSKERFSLAEEVGDSETKTICSIRAQSFKGKSTTTPKLGWWKRKNWVPVKTGSNKHILLNIDSIAKNTGLTREQIQEAAASRTPGVTLEKTLTNAMRESHRVAEGVRSQLLKKKSQFYRVKCNAKGKVNDKTLCEAFKLTPEQVSIAKKENLFQFVDKRSLQDGDYTCNVILQIASQPKRLKKTVQEIHKLRKKVLTSKAKNRNADSSIQYTVNHHIIGIEANLFTYVNPSGEMYLSSLSQSIGKGSFKEVFSGFAVDTGEEVAIGLPLQKDQNDLVELELLMKLQGLSGVCQYHTCFEIDSDCNAKPQLGFIMHYYNGGDLENNFDSILSQDLSKQVPIQLLVMSKLADGMQHIHDKEIVHNDIKPGNILLVKDKNSKKIQDAVFADFGMASEGEITKGTLKGSPSNLSPRKLAVIQKTTDGGETIEQLTGGGEFTDDVWALGIAFYQMLKPATDIPGFKERTILEKIIRQNGVFEKDEIEFFKKNNITTTNQFFKYYQREAMNHFGSKRPENLASLDTSKILEMSREDRFKIIQNKMEQLCWDMLFSSPKMTARDVVIRKNQINSDFEAYRLSEEI